MAMLEWWQRAKEMIQSIYDMSLVVAGFVMKLWRVTEVS
jgi:hypothetical protein